MAGDRDFEAFYAATYDRLVGQLLVVTGSLQEAEDLVQEAFVRACGRWPHLRDYDLPEAWVRRVALNLAASGLRRAARRGGARAAPCRGPVGPGDRPPARGAGGDGDGAAVAGAGGAGPLARRRGRGDWPCAGMTWIWTSGWPAWPPRARVTPARPRRPRSTGAAAAGGGDRPWGWSWLPLRWVARWSPSGPPGRHRPCPPGRRRAPPRSRQRQAGGSSPGSRRQHGQRRSTSWGLPRSNRARRLARRASSRRRPAGRARPARWPAPCALPVGQRRPASWRDTRPSPCWTGTAGRCSWRATQSQATRLRPRFCCVPGWRRASSSSGGTGAAPALDRLACASPCRAAARSSPLSTLTRAGT